MTDNNVVDDDYATPSPDKVRCEACPIRCFIKVGQTGSCDRYGNVDGQLVRMDPVSVLLHASDHGSEVVPFALDAGQWTGELIRSAQPRLIGAGAGTTYPDYKPAPFIVSSEVDGVDTVTVVTEGIFSYCGVKVKIDTDRFVGPERSLVFAEDEPVGHVTTSEYGSQMLSIGGVHHLTGLTRRTGLATMRTLLALCDRETVELQVEGGAHLALAAGQAPIVNGTTEQVMRVGCGSAAVGMFAGSWHTVVDEVIVLDDHITGVLSQHQAGAVLGMPASGIRIVGRKSTPGRFFNVAEPGSGWGGLNVDDPLEFIKSIDRSAAWSGMRVLMTTTTGDASVYFELDDDLQPVLHEPPAAVRATVDQIAANCEPARTSVMFMAGAGGSLRSGATRQPILLTTSVREGRTRVTCGGADVYIWPGGGITFMVDVERVPTGSFGHVPTPALVAPLEFTMPRDDYVALGGHESSIRDIDDVIGAEAIRIVHP